MDFSVEFYETSDGGRRIIAVHGIRNKQQSLPARDFGTARARMKDWLNRHSA